MIELPNRLHFVGIGGTGLSAIARVLLQRGYTISGSDRAPSPILDALAADGARVFVGHAADQLGDAQAVIVTSAAPEANPEIQAARAAGIPVYKRSAMIGAVMAGQTAVCVAGTHGKTTTTAMLAHILMQTGRDPSFIVGSHVASLGTNARHGHGDAFVIEADEYDYMFLGLHPQIAIVNNIEWDHPDFFTTPEQFTAAFDQFADRLPPDGTLIACAEDPGAAALADRIRRTGRRVLTFGLTQGDLTVAALPLTLAVPGDHNRLNAAAALTAATCLGVSPMTAIAALNSFTGTGRRFDVRHDNGAIALIDDYAHHPTAIRVTLAAARSRYPDRALWVVWQPHTYSRTRALLKDYMTAFADADGVIVTEIYAAREAPDLHTTGAIVADAIRHRHVHFAPTPAAAVELLTGHVRAPAAVLILSAGDAPAIGERYWAQRTSAP